LPELFDSKALLEAVEVWLDRLRTNATDSLEALAAIAAGIEIAEGDVDRVRALVQRELAVLEVVARAWRPRFVIIRDLVSTTGANATKPGTEAHELTVKAENVDELVHRFVTSGSSLFAFLMLADRLRSEHGEIRKIEQKILSMEEHARTFEDEQGRLERELRDLAAAEKDDSSKGEIHARRINTVRSDIDRRREMAESSHEKIARKRSDANERRVELRATVERVAGDEKR
jgi:hypothetical protein